MQKLLALIVYIFVSSFFYSSKRVIKEINSYSENWVAGVQGGGRGIEYYFNFKILTADKIEFDTLWINNKAFKTYLQNNKKTVSDKPITFSKNDTVVVRASEFVNERIPTNQVAKAPISYKGTALLRYTVNKKNYYYSIKKIIKKESIYRP